MAMLNALMIVCMSLSSIGMLIILLLLVVILMCMGGVIPPKDSLLFCAKYGDESKHEYRNYDGVDFVVIKSEQM